MRNLSLVCGCVGAMMFQAPMPASAYPIDCAILLCLAGGFPPSEPCARAKAEMIRRVTPWPIEPPLQIWNCPMRAMLRAEPSDGEGVRLWSIAFAEAASFRGAAAGTNTASRMASPVVPAAAETYSTENGKADVDISGAEFAFLRSIRLFSVERASQRWKHGGGDFCEQSQRVQLGSYGPQGDFKWVSSSVSALPSSFKGLESWAKPPILGEAQCPGLSKRAVFLEWRDHSGGYGFQQIDY